VNEEEEGEEEEAGEAPGVTALLRENEDIHVLGGGAAGEAVVVAVALLGEVACPFSALFNKFSVSLGLFL